MKNLSPMKKPICFIAQNLPCIETFLSQIVTLLIGFNPVIRTGQFYFESLLICESAHSNSTGQFYFETLPCPLHLTLAELHVRVLMSLFKLIKLLQNLMKLLPNHTIKFLLKTDFKYHSKGLYNKKDIEISTYI